MTESEPPLESGAHRQPADIAGRTRRRAGLLILVGLLLHAPSLTWGFMYDDFSHQIVLRGFEHGTRLRPWSLYDFGARPEPGSKPYALGVFPWWTDADFKVRFFRPITSLTIWLDWLMYGTWAPGYHFTSLAWFAAFLVLCFALFRRLGAGPTASLWALGFLSLDDIHVMAVQWIANRNTLVAGTFLAAMMLALDRHRRSRSIGSLALAGLLFLLACGAKESGIAGSPLAGLYFLCFDRRSTSESLADGVRRVLGTPAFWFMTALGIAYAVTYVAMGFGASSLDYITPLTNPVAYALQVALLIPIAPMSLFFGTPADSFLMYPQLVLPTAVGGVIVALIAARSLLRTIGYPWKAGFAGGWILLAVLPSAGVMYSDRLFMIASVGSAFLLGLYFDRVGSLRTLRARRQYSQLALAGVLLLAGPVASVPSCVVRGYVLSTLGTFDRDVIINARIDRSIPPPRHVIVLNAPSSMIAISLSSTWGVTFDDDRTATFCLQFGRRAITWTRIDERTMMLRSESQPFLTGVLERLLLASEPTPEVGDRYRTAAFEAEIAQVDPGGLRAVKFTFAKPLEDPAYQFLAWREADESNPPPSANGNSAAWRGGLGRVEPPAVGQTRRLPEVEPLYSFVP